MLAWMRHHFCSFETDRSCEKSCVFPTTMHHCFCGGESQSDKNEKIGLITLMFIEREHLFSQLCTQVLPVLVPPMSHSLLASN